MSLSKEGAEWTYKKSELPRVAGEKNFGWDIHFEENLMVWVEHERLAKLLCDAHNKIVSRLTQEKDKLATKLRDMEGKEA